MFKLCVGLISFVFYAHLCFALQQSEDIVKVTGGVQRVGLLVSGANAIGQQVVGQTSCGINGQIAVGDIRSGSINEVIGFTRTKHPEVVPAAWSNGVDTVDVIFQGLEAVPIQFWVIQKAVSFSKEKLALGDAMLRAIDLWNREGVGIAINSCEFIDSSDKKSYLDVVVTGPTDKIWQDLRNDVGYRNNKLNVYWVRTVNGNPGSGVANFGLQMVIGSSASVDLLAHEIGHAFSLGDVGALAAFDSENVMAESSSNRQYFSEGQTFRAQFNIYSVLNSVFNVHSGMGVRDCDSVPSPCPALDERLWDDGLFGGKCP